MQAFPYIIKHTHNIKVTTIIAPQCLQLSLSTPIPNKENHKVLINRQSLRRCTIFFKLLWQRGYKSLIIILLSKIFFLVGDMFFSFLQPKILSFGVRGNFHHTFQSFVSICETLLVLIKFATDFIEKLPLLDGIRINLSFWCGEGKVGKELLMHHRDQTFV